MRSIIQLGKAVGGARHKYRTGGGDGSRGGRRSETRSEMGSGVDARCGRRAGRDVPPPQSTAARARPAPPLFSQRPPDRTARARYGSDIINTPSPADGVTDKQPLLLHC